MALGVRNIPKGEGQGFPEPRTAPVGNQQIGCAHPWVLTQSWAPAALAGLTVYAWGAERRGQGRSSGILTLPDHVSPTLDPTYPPAWAPWDRTGFTLAPQPFYWAI